MRIRILRNLGRGLPPYTEGQVVDVEPADGEQLCSDGLATAIVQAIPKSAMSAVPPEPALRSARTPEDEPAQSPVSKQIRKQVGE